MTTHRADTGHPLNRTSNRSSFTRVASRMTFLSIILTILHRRIFWFAACFSSLLPFRSTYAQPLPIRVSAAQYQAEIRAAWTSYSTNLASSSSSPTSVDLSVNLDANSDATGNANANLFEVRASIGTWGTGAFGWSSASSSLCFSPVVDKTQTLGIQFNDYWRPYTGGAAKLTDMTSDLELWNYAWSPIHNGNVPWTSTGFSSWSAVLNLETDFLASHQYELTMSTYGNSADDYESCGIQLTGLQVVPEPSSLCLLLMLGTPTLRVCFRGRCR